MNFFCLGNWAYISSSFMGDVELSFEINWESWIVSRLVEELSLNRGFYSIRARFKVYWRNIV